jgi:hypothetical protein
VALALLFVVHGAVTRSLLSGGRLRSWINTTPETTLLDWDEAVSTVPGRLQVKNLKIRGSDVNVQWIIRLAEARVDYSVLALLTRTFRVSAVRGSGLTFRLRQKLEPADVSEAKVALLPPIDGFSDPPLRRPEPEVAADDGGRPWTVDVRGIAIDRFEEIWLDVQRFDGRARVTGRFLLRPGQRARVGPATVEFADGRLGIGRDPVAVAVAGSLESSIAEWDPRRVHGDAVWRNVTAGIRLRGRSEGLEFLNYFVRSASEPRFSGGRGSMSLAGAIEEGRASGDWDLTSRSGEARLEKTSLMGDVEAHVHVARWNLEKGPMVLDSSRLRLSDVVAAGMDRSLGWWGRFDLPKASVDDGRLSGRVEARCRDARPLFAIFSVDLPRWARSLLEMEGLEASAEVQLSRARTRVHDLIAEGEKLRILGEYDRRGENRRGVFLIDGGTIDVGVRLHEGGAGVRLLGAKSWFARESELITSASDERSDRNAGK